MDTPADSPIVLVHLTASGDFDITATPGVTIAWVDENGDTPATRLTFFPPAKTREEVVAKINAIAGRPCPAVRPDPAPERPADYPPLRLVSSQ